MAVLPSIPYQNDLSNFLFESFLFAFQLFTDGYCRFDGSLIENLEGISSVETCQLACQFDANCKYFIYYKNENVCETLDDDAYTCDVVRGPPTPTIENCTMTSYFRTEETKISQLFSFFKSASKYFTW